MSRQLPAYSPLTAAALWSGVRAALGQDRAATARLRTRITETFGACASLLTDSGTSALVVALRIALLARAGSGRILLPAYACPDLLTAVDAVGADAALYDLDPATLGPDMDDLGCQLAGGAAAVVVAHLYGIPVDVRAVHALAVSAGAVVIEDAAQGVGGRLDGRALGSHGALGVLSFGRGKGRTGGAGGACLVNDPALDAFAVAMGAGLEAGGSGWGPLVGAAAQWLLSPPLLYGIAAQLAGNRIGTTQYHAPWTPTMMPAACLAVVDAVWELADDESHVRRAAAAAWYARLSGRPELLLPASGAGHRAEAGMLRMPVVGVTRALETNLGLGLVPGYPRTLASYPASPTSAAAIREYPGASLLAERLVTLPVHGRLVPTAVPAIANCFGAAD